MPNRHKNPGISWHPADPTLKPWIKAEAERQGLTGKALLDEALAEYRARRAAAQERDAGSTP
jgi:hypothetical protein